MNVRRLVTLLALIFAVPAAPTGVMAQDADLILTGARVWTADADRPRAEAVAVRGDRILAVGDSAAVAEHRAPHTRVIDAIGRFIAPGFIDNHTHFNRAGALILGINLLDVADERGLVRRVLDARDRMPRGAWIVGGDWGAYEAWAQGSTGDEPAEPADYAPFRPHRSMIDSITPETPVLLSRWDGSEHLANGLALDRAGADCAWDGVECDGSGRPTGRLSPEAADRIRDAIPPRPPEQRLAEARAALERLRGFGVTTIHDITPPDQLRIFQELHRRGELTVRIYARPTLDKWDELADVGIRHGFGDDWLKIGGLKGFVDGIMGNSSARFYEPYLTSGERGEWRDSTNTGAASGPGSGMEPPGTMQRNLLGADSTGHWAQVHAIGDEAIDTLLDLYEQVLRARQASASSAPTAGSAVSTAGSASPASTATAAEGPEPRLRLIHTQVLRGPDVARRMANLGIIAEVQPYHAIDDMRWMEERIGERARWAYAFKTLHGAGVRLSFGSDWPGTNAAWYTADPVMGIYAAVARQTPEGEPPGGWFPQERVDVETALRAYTINNAYAAGEEAVKGSIEPGKLADLVVLDRDPFRVDRAELKELRALYTVVGGEVVYEAEERTAAR